MPNQEELKARLLATHKHLIRLREDKMEMLRAAEGMERRLRLSTRVPRIGRRARDANTCPWHRTRMRDIERILPEIVYLSYHISNIENELDEIGDYEY